MCLFEWNKIVFLSGVCLTCASAGAASEFDPQGLEAGLYVRRDDMVIENPATSLDVRMDRLGLSLSEKVHTRLSLGLLGGIAAADITGQSVTNGMQPTGGYVGVNLVGSAFGGQHWHIGYEMSLLYQSLDDEMSGQLVELDWLESGAAVKVNFSVSDRVSLYAGPHYRNLEVDQRVRGVVSSTSSFSEQDSMEAVLGTALEVDPGGFIDLAVHRGASDGFMLAFSRKY
jgi:hypothetical protein